MKQNGLRKYPN